MSVAEPFSGDLTDSVWVLAAPGAGDNRQLEAVAAMLDFDTRWMTEFDPVKRVLVDRLRWPWRKGIPADKADRLEPPWPRLVLLAGGRSVIDACRIRDASGGRSKLVCLGRPWAPLDWFDLVVTTPQYRLPEAENVLTLDLPLNMPERPDSGQLSYWRDQFGALPRPLVGVLLGGASGSYRFPAASADALSEQLNALLAANDGSAVIVASPRTPQAAMAHLKSRFQAPGRVFEWHPSGGANPFRALLSLADAFVVTGDSASMIADASFTGKPLAVFDLPERMAARSNRFLRRWTQPFALLQRRLTRRGFWVPARDMRRLHQRLVAAGRIVPLSALTSASTIEGNVVDEISSTLRERVDQLLSR